jgi:hypothetical protein
LKDAETVDAMLRGKHVVHGELVRNSTGNPRCYRNRDTGAVAKGERGSPERLAQLDELVRAARITVDNGLAVLRGPGGCTPLEEAFATWFLSSGKGVSLLWSANRLGRSEETFAAVLNEKDRLAKYNKVEALASRRQEAERYGGYRRSVFIKRLERGVVDILRGRVSPFAQAIVVAVCDHCGEGDIGFDQNTQHRCTIEDEKNDAHLIKLGARGATAQFSQYLRVLYLHDLLNHPITLDYVNEEDLDELGVYSVPALEYLTGDDGKRLPDLPPAIDISTLDGDVIWRREDTPPHMLLASAMDVAARTTAEAFDAQNDSKATTSFGPLRPDKRRAMLGSIFAPSQDKLWADSFWDSVAAAIAYNRRKVLICHHTEATCMTFSVRSANAERRAQYSHVCNRGAGVKRSTKPNTCLVRRPTLVNCRTLFSACASSRPLSRRTNGVGRF